MADQRCVHGVLLGPQFRECANCEIERLRATVDELCSQSNQAEFVLSEVLRIIHQYKNEEADRG